MKLFWLLILSLFIYLPVYAQTTIDGYDYTTADLLEYNGIVGIPSTSNTGMARTYFDASSGKLKCSENGGAYADCVGSGSGSGNIGIGTANTITFWPTTTTIGSLPTDTYPSLPELSYVKGATSPLQEQIDGLGVGVGGWTDGGTNVFVSVTTDNVGIGTTTPTAKLMVNNTGTGTSFRVDDALADTSPFIVMSNGNVGIGTTSPSANFQYGSVAASNFITMNTPSAPAMAIRADSASTVDLLNIQGSGISSGNALDVSSTSSSTFVAPLVQFVTSGANMSYPTLFVQQGGIGEALKVNDVSGDTTPFVVSSVGNVGIGTIKPNAQLDIRNQGVTPFMVNSGATISSGDYLTVLSGGNVGIGTFSPEKKFVISSTDTDMIIRGTTNSSFNEMAMHNDAGEALVIGASGTAASGGLQGYINMVQNAPVNILTNDTTRVTIDRSGNVGIGSNAPNSILNIPSLQSTSGTRYLCIGTTGIVTSSAIACAGT